MSPLRVLLAAGLTLALAAGPAAAQSTAPSDTATIPGATVTIPGAGSNPDPGAAPGGSTTSPGGTTPSGTTTSPGTTSVPEITAAQAGDGALLDAADRVELASALAEATAESGVCFGYTVDLGGSGASSRSETLTNAGPDRTPDQADCPKGALELQVSITYTSESSESEDSASFRVSSSVPSLSPSAATQRLKDLSGVNDGDFLGSKDDLALRNATAVLPLLLDGATPAELPAPPANGKAPNNDRLTGSPPSDWIRQHGIGIGIGFVVFALALVLLVGGLVARRADHATNPPRRPPPSPTGPSDPPAGSSSTTTPIS